MDKPRILITGSSGFIGSALARNLSERYHVIGLDRSPPKEKVEGVEQQKMDISSPESIAQALDEVHAKHGNKIASVVHLAAYYSFSGKEDARYQSITVKGTENFLVALKRRFRIEQFIFSSTMLVHAPTEPGLEISEKSRVDPSWPYPQSKVEAERVIEENKNHVPVVNLRIAGVYDDYCHSIPIAQHFARIFERQVSSVFFPGDPSHGQAFLHLDDLAVAVAATVERRRFLPGKVDVLLGEDQPLSHRDLQAEIGKELHGRAWPTFRVPALMAKAGAFALERLPYAREPFIKPWMIDYADEHYDLNISRARKLLGWEPKRRLRDTLPLMAKSLLENPEKWYRDHKIEKPRLQKLEPVDWPREYAYLTMTAFSFFLGIWLFSNPFTLGYTNSFAFWSDLVSGLAVAGFALLSVAPTLRWLRWANAAIGCWVMFSPLAFWTASAAIYSNNSLLGALILLASAYTPSRLLTRSSMPAPTRFSEAVQAADRPPGWSYNPSSWPQRLPIMTLAFVAFLLARYLAAFQLGHIDSAWDPFFGDGTEVILTSSVSHAFPVSDAGLGAFSYLLDLIAASIGDRRRWKTMPWMVILFGLFIVPTGVTSIVLVMLQPIAVDQWCTICLATAAIMLVMVPPAVDEVVASVQFLSQSRREGKSLWKMFWLGDQTDKIQTPKIKTSKPAPGGGTFPYHLAVQCLLGTWLFFVPTVFAITDAAANNIYIVAALIVTFAVIAFSEIARIVRLVNIPLGIWLAISAWFVGTMPMLAQWNSFVVGFALALLSLPRGRVNESFGELNSKVFWTPVNELDGTSLPVFRRKHRREKKRPGGSEKDAA